MKLNDEEQAMLAGAFGPARAWALAHQVEVGRFFGAADLVPVTQAHIMADGESLGEACVSWLEQWAALNDAERRVRVPTVTDPRGTDFDKADVLKHTPAMVALERRLVAGLESLGVLVTNTCINYQTVIHPLRGEHVAFGDTGVVIYCNSVLGARSNFEGGPSALAAALTGRTLRYGFHLPEKRRATLIIEAGFSPRGLDDWGALGALAGRVAGNYWAVPAITAVEGAPGSDALKHFGAAAASFGSVALFHMPGITPEAPRLEDVCDPSKLPVFRIGAEEIADLRAEYCRQDGVDVVVFAAPQLSLTEIAQVAGLCDGRHFRVPVLVVTSPQVKPDADRLGLTARIEQAGGTVLTGNCFYQSWAREVGEANGWRRLMTNSFKLANIIGGYGYRPTLASMEECIETAAREGNRA